ncbi:MAG TPA: hypothetical protein VFX03_17100 [Thermomicrobiales bacterium]|nr:hypothetical protein [Thermomicrobiales bacterium]
MGGSAATHAPIRAKERAIGLGQRGRQGRMRLASPENGRRDGWRAPQYRELKLLWLVDTLPLKTTGRPFPSERQAAASRHALMRFSPKMAAGMRERLP